MYSIDDYDDKGVLKPGIFLLISNLYIARFLLFGPLSIFAKFRGFSSGPSLDTSFLTDVSPFEMLSSIPAVILVFIMLARNADSGTWMRKTWEKGREILLSCLLTQIAIHGIRIFSSESIALSDVVIGIVNLYFVVYLVSGTRPKIVFSMFPEKKTAPESATS